MDSMDSDSLILNNIELFNVIYNSNLLTLKKILILNNIDGSHFLFLSMPGKIAQRCFHNWAQWGTLSSWRGEKYCVQHHWRRRA